ncbi:MAG: PorT family protein [Taibaiella sp.]|nr:PorT family protein [Taibaiella sp.]
MSKVRKFAVFIALAITGIGFFTKVYSQENFYVDEPRVFYGGLIGGVNIAQVDGDNFAGYDKIGVNVGAIVYAQLKEHVALSLEILYSQKGSKSNIVRETFVDNRPVYIESYAIKVNYAEIPVMINYFDKRKSHAGIGLSYSQLVSSSETLQILDQNALSNVDLTKYAFKKVDLNILAGVELHLWQGLFLNVRFQYSLLPIRTDIPPNYSRANQYNNLWVVRLMYLLK